MIDASRRLSMSSPGGVEVEALHIEEELQAGHERLVRTKEDVVEARRRETEMHV